MARASNSFWRMGRRLELEEEASVLVDMYDVSGEAGSGSRSGYGMISGTVDSGIQLTFRWPFKICKPASQQAASSKQQARRGRGLLA